MREPVEPVKPGHEVASSLTWSGDDSIRPGARVEATDGPFGVVRERRSDAGPEPSYLGIDTDAGLLFMPERLIRETRADTVVLSLPIADVRAQSVTQLPPRSGV
jgi:hypothetical protein